MVVVIREARSEDVAALKDRLREADVKEIIASGKASPESALKDAAARSTLCYTLDLDRSPVGMFGLVPDTILGPTANVWLLGAPEIARFKKTFLRLSREVIAEFLSRFPVLWNVVDARYKATLRWLTACGAQFHEPIIINGFEFIPFVLVRRT